MRNTRKSGQILRSRKRPRPTGRSGRGSRANSNTSHQIPARVIEADGARAVWVPDPRSLALAASAGELEYSIGGKWLELLKEVAPSVTRAAILRDAALGSGTNLF